ncbi:B3 domain-containing transcription factor VRN1-like [Argentina anserina]|uniref:B3 domain-containing transcription factor VRN1-like n=1 Tax=Argentina anserina TaxID=57926 RepID=UPI0021763514|nr:B3 domain-containing transcription factor VRN1-like [Potentilla anserina]
MSSLPPKVGCRPRFQKIFFTYFPEKVKRKLVSFFFSVNMSYLITFVLEAKNCHVVQKLPVKFVKDHGDELSNPVHFKFRGIEWPMKLKRHKDEAWFDKGWEEFSKSYSFEYNDLLIFAYEGNSTFQVSLFDRPPKLIESDEDDLIPPSPQPHITTHSSGGQAEVQEEASSLETIHRSRLELKRKRDLVAEKDDGEAEYELNTRQGIKNSRMRRKLDFSGKRNRGQRFQRASETMQRVKPEYPLFKIELLQNVNYGLILSLPYEFMRTHLSSESGEVTLQVSDGRIWKVALKCENSRAEFHDHWWEFIQDNQLKVGDACVFMLIDYARPLFEVVIFHKDQTIQPINCVLPTDNTCIDNASIDEDNDDEEDNNENDQDNNIDAEDDNTSFEIVIQPSYTNHLWLPSKFSQIFLTSDATYASLCVSGGKSNWPVKLKHYGQRVQVQDGWSNFVQDNNLKVGHVCKFMFNDTARLSFEVAIEAGNTLVKVIITYMSSIDIDIHMARDNEGIL